MAASFAPAESMDPEWPKGHSGSLRLLMVEDSHSDAQLIAEELNDALGEHLELEQVTSLNAALLRLDAQAFDAVLTDLNVPDSSGVETYRWLQNAAPNIPIIVLTMERDSALVTELFRLGAQDCLVKGEYAGWMLMRAVHSSVQRKRAMLELDARAAGIRQSESRIRQIIEDSSSAFLVVDLNGVVRFANEVAGRMLRFSDGASIGHRFRYAHSLSLDRKIEIDIACSGGTFGKAEVQAVPAMWDGHAAYLVSIHDITARKVAEDELQSTSVRLRAALEGGGGIGTWDLDAELRMLTWDQSIAKLVGDCGNFQRGARMRELLPLIHEEDREAVAAAVRGALAGSGDVDLEFRICPAPDRVVWLSVKGHADHIVDGVPTHITGACMDITTRKSTELAHARGQKLEALGSLAAGIAHDFNNILSAINGNVVLALDDTADLAARKRLENIRQAGARAVDLVRQILAFSRPTEPTFRPIDLAPILEEARRLLRASIPTMVDLRIEVEQGLPLVRIDGTQVHQIIVNLATNSWHAIGYGKRGSIDVKLAAVTLDGSNVEPNVKLSSGDYVRLTVADSGSGMDAGTLSRIFDPFFTTKPSGQGTGLGLSVVHGIVQSAGGAIAVSSKVGEGTVFKLYFPAVPDPSAARHHGEAQAGRGQHLMYIDDDEFLTDLAVDMLSSHGYEVTGFCDPQKAVDAFRSDPELYELVITDVSMPEMSGFDVSRELLGIRADVPIIMLSGTVKSNERQLAAEMGICAVAQKPNDVATLCELVKQALIRH